MKIAILINKLSIRGGTHKQVLRLLEYLTEQGEDVTVYTKYYDISKTYPEFSNYNIVCTGNKENSSKNNGLAGRIRRRMTMIESDKLLLDSIPDDTDIINIHDNGLLFVFPFIHKKKRAKVVWQINDLHPSFNVGASVNAEKKSISGKVNRMLNRYAAKKSDRITVNVTKNKERVIENLKCGADVFYCGVDKNTALKKHGYPVNSGTINLLSTGVFAPYRNYESLVAVVEKLTERGYNVHLDIIGSTELDKSYSAKITELIANKNMGDKVTVWGQVDEEKYNKLYNRAHMFLFLNIDQSWGLAVFEAMSCGMPVIVSDSVGAIELLHNNEDSVIIEPKDIDLICESILNLSGNKEFYEKISANAMRAVEEFTWDKLYSERMLNLFKELHNKK